MRVDKVILRAALSTLAAIFSLFIFLTALLCFVYPSTVMELAYDVGMDSVSIRFALNTYERTDDVYFLAYATEVAISSDDKAKIESCGKRLLADDGFEAFCLAKDGNTDGAMGYGEYIQRTLSITQYELGKISEAIDTALAATKGFPENNAFAGLLLTAMKGGDLATVEQMKGKMNEMSVGSFSESERDYYQAILHALEMWQNG